mgnify:CR=1 FL=1
MARAGLTYRQAFNTTIEQFNVYQKAFEIQLVDRLHIAAKTAWYTQAAKATKGKGKNIRSAYSSFDNFFDYELEYMKLFNSSIRKTKKNTMADVNRLMNEYLEKGGTG